MTKTIIICLCTIVIACSCNTTQKETIAKEKKPITTGFILNGKLTNYLSKKVYLNKIIENNYYPIDSTIITDNTFKFEGIVTYPERFALTFEYYSASLVLILENSTIDITIDPTLVQEPTIKGSVLNTTLNDYKIGSKNIFKKINYLFPQFQKARLENDANKLTEIGEKVAVIENEFREYTYNFILKNKNSYVAAMLLRDQLKTTAIDTVRIKKAYNLLSEEVKKSPDSKIIKQVLNLH